MIFPGVIKRTFSYGCFVEFPNGLTGLSPIRFLSDEFLSEATGVYRDMQTVFAKVIATRSDHNVYLSLRFKKLIWRKNVFFLAFVHLIFEYFSFTHQRMLRIC